MCWVLLNSVLSTLSTVPVDKRTIFISVWLENPFFQSHRSSYRNIDYSRLDYCNNLNVSIYHGSINYTSVNLTHSTFSLLVGYDDRIEWSQFIFKLFFEVLCFKVIRSSFAAIVQTVWKISLRGPMFKSAHSKAQHFQV